MKEQKFNYKFVCKVHKNCHAWSVDTMPVLKCDQCRSLMVFSGEKKDITSKTNEELREMYRENESKRLQHKKWIFI